MMCPECLARVLAPGMTTCAECGKARAAYNLDPAKGGIKYDADKIRVELLSLGAILEVGRVATYGARKYADHNWRKGMSWARMLGAALRHLFAWGMGEDNDPESGLPHLAHAAWCVMALIEFQKTGTGSDDRFTLPAWFHPPK